MKMHTLMIAALAGMVVGCSTILNRGTTYEDFLAAMSDEPEYECNPQIIMPVVDTVSAALLMAYGITISLSEEFQEAMADVSALNMLTADVAVGSALGLGVSAYTGFQNAAACERLPEVRNNFTEAVGPEVNLDQEITNIFSTNITDEQRGELMELLLDESARQQIQLFRNYDPPSR